MSNPVLSLRISAEPPEAGEGYPSYRQLIQQLPNQIRIALESSDNNVVLLWLGPTPPPNDLTGRAVWMKTDDQNRVVALFVHVNGSYEEAFPGHRFGDLMYRVPAATDDGPWKVADGTNGTTDLSAQSGFQLGSAKLHQFVGVTIP